MSIDRDIQSSYVLDHNCYVIDNVHLKFNRCASCCMGLSTTPLVPVLSAHYMSFFVTFPELACHYRMRKR